MPPPHLQFHFPVNQQQREITRSCVFIHSAHPIEGRSESGKGEEEKKCHFGPTPDLGDMVISCEAVKLKIGIDFNRRRAG